MPLDLQPVNDGALDLQPVEATPLDLQPAPRAQVLQGSFLPSQFSSGTARIEPPAVNPDWALTADVAQNLPSDAANLSRGTVADIAAGMRAVKTGAKEASQFSGNIPAALSRAPLPIDAALAAASQESPGWATVGKISQGIAGTAPLTVIGGLPATAQKLALLGFTTRMIADAPHVAAALGDELGKPKAEQDPDKITSLVSDAVQITGFSALGGLHLMHAAGAALAGPLIDKYVPRGAGIQGSEARFTPVKTAPAPAAAPTAEGKPGEFVSEFGGVAQAAPLDIQPAAEAGPTPEVQAQPEATPAPEPVQNEAAAMSPIERKVISEAVAAKEPIPAGLAERRIAEGGFVLPEGYDREGDQYIYSEPAQPETSAARMAREQREAMAALRTQEPPVQPAAAPEERAPITPTDRPEPGVPISTGERPPDIIDEVEGHFPGVAVPDSADFADVRERLKALRQSKAADLSGTKLKSLFRGEAPDTALDGLHRAGAAIGIQNGHELLHAMVDAARARVAWAEQERAAAKFTPPEPAAEEIDPWQSTIDKLNSLKLDTRGQLHAFGLLPEAWNQLIDLVNLGVRGGKAIAEAVDWAIGQFKAKFPGTAFDEAGARQHLQSNFGERATGQKILSAPDISGPAKDAVSEYIYQRRTNATDQEIADGVVKDLGLDRAIDAWRAPPANMPGAVRSKLLGSITRALVDQERVARASGKPEAAEALADRQGKLWNEALPQITDLAQSLQALNDLVDLSPDGQVARVRRRLEDVAREAIDRRRPEVEQIRAALEQGRAAGVEAVKTDPAANAAARAAVDATVAQSPETHKAVVMELAEPWASSPEIVQMARDQVRSKAEELLNKQPRPPGLTPAQHLRTFLDDLAKRAASIAAGHFQGAEPGVILRDKLRGRLGLDEAHATRLADQLDREFARQVKAAKDKLPKRIAAQRAARDRNAGLLLTSPDTAVDAAIRRQLRDLNLKLGDAIKQESGATDATGRHVAERIVQTSGLTGEAADTFRTRLQARWDALVTDAQQRALRAIEARSGVTTTRPIKDAFTRLVELDRLSGVTDERFQSVVKQSLKLKELSDGDARQLRQLVQRAQEQPAGFLRERAATDVLQTTEKLAGNQRWWDVPMAIFYANILSGLTTPAKIVLENTNMLVGNTLTEFLSRPGENLLHPVDFLRQVGKAYGRGLAKGGLQAESTLRTGKITGIWERGRTNVLESRPFGRFEPVNFWKYFTRAIGTAHETTFKPAWEVKQTLLAREVARREGLRGTVLDQRVADLMANTDDAVAKAKGQAVADLAGVGRMKPQQPGESTVGYLKRSAADRLDLARRTREILEQEREINMPGSTEVARDYALRTAYLNEPYGFLGMIASGIRSVLEKGRREFPVLGTLAKTQIPFTTVVANILNEKLNWTPAGLVRAIASQRTGELYGRPIMSANERAQLYAKSIAGTIAVGALADLFGNHIHGNGPADPKKRKQLQQAGWIPHSIELNGHYYSYMNTPAALSLAVIGNWKDWHRYGKGEETDGLGRVAFATKATANAIVSQGMLDSVRRLFEALGSESTTDGGKQLETMTARTASAFVVPSLVQQVDRMFDPTVYDQTGAGALVNSQIPFARRQNKPALNILGEPMKSGPFHYWASDQSQDPVWRLLADKQVFIPEPSKSAIIGTKKAGEGYYRAITPDEYYDLIAESGPKLRSEIQKRLPQLQAMQPEQVQTVIESLANAEHTAAKAKLR